MSNLPVETTEPDPAATSISNDQTVNKEAGDASAPTNTETAMAEAEPAKSNGATEVKAEKADVDMEKDGEEVKKENGHSPKAKKEHHNKKDYNQRDNKYRKPYVKHNNYSKYDPSVLPESSDAGKMRGQVEYYFSDSNLPTDANMWKQTDGTSNLPVSIKHIHSFKRMHRFPSYEAVVAALRDSAFLDVVGEEGEEMVKRKVAYDPSWSRSDEVKKRSVYAKGFGDEEPSSQFDIEAFFTTYGPTNRVTLRRDDDKRFKGSVFVEFHDEQTAEAFLKLDPKPLWKGKHELEIKPKGEYMAGKKKEIDDGSLQPKESWGPDRGRGGQGRGRGRGRGRDYNDRNGRGGRDYDRGRDRGDRDPDDWKKRREEDRASGFKDPRGNRKDRGHNKGGRGGRRDDRGPRNNDRNRERDGDKEDKAVKSEDSPAKDTKTEESTPAVKKEETTPVKNDKKRAREDDDGEEGGPAKKVDSKSEVPVEAS